MILTCPACSSRYLIDPAALGGKGRTVRCAGCDHQWFAEPPDDAPRSAVTDPPARRPDQAAAVRAATGPSVRLVGWLVLALVVLLAAAAVVGRNEVVASFPQAASVYRHLGLPVSVPLGLEFRDVTSSRLEEGGVAVLVIEGAIVNITAQDRAVPRVRVALLDDDDRELEHELVAAAERALSGGGTTRFVARLVSPPTEASSFSVTFAADG